MKQGLGFVKVKQSIRTTTVTAKLGEGRELHYLKGLSFFL